MSVLIVALSYLAKVFEYSVLIPSSPVMTCSL
jgi:hypothetical protein